MDAKIYNRSCWLYFTEDFNINDIFESLLIKSDFRILNSVDQKFSPYGYTKIWIIAESHLAIHTFPEEDVLYIELSSCIESKAKLFWQYFMEWASKNHKKTQLMKKNIYLVNIPYDYKK